MDLLDYLTILRRRWVVVAASALAAAVVALVTLPPGPGQAAVPQANITNYKATTTLLQTSTSAATVPVTTLPVFVSTGEVPKAAAKELGYTDDPNLLGQLVNVSIDDETGTIGISATDADAERATATANAFSSALIDFLRKRAQADIDRKIELLENVLKRYRERRDTITGGDDLSVAQRAALDGAYNAVQNEIVALQVSSATAGFDLEVLQPATAVPVLSKNSGPVTNGPSNRWLRSAVLVGLGVLVGAGLALALERFDTRLRGRKAVEDALRLPVVATVPAIPHRQRGRHEVLAVRDPEGGVAEAYRSLRSAVQLLPAWPLSPDLATGPADELHPEPSAVRDPRVLLFASARARDGKTTSLVNLASTLAESGRSVIVLDCDFRHPEAHEFLGVPAGRGLSDLLAADKELPLGSVLQPTAIVGVQLAMAGSSTQHPGALMGLMADYIAQARALADVVLIDAPPVLLANDAVDLMPVVDAVVVVVRDGKTGRSEVQRLAALLGRLRTPCVGAVLVAAHDAAAAYFRRGESGRRAQHQPLHDKTPEGEGKPAASRPRKHVRGKR